MNDDNRVRLRIMGISYNPLKSGAFALLLAQVDGPYRIPVMIGALEAQSIAIKIEGVVTPRPVTHDVIMSMMHAFGISLEEVFIYKFEDGIFYSMLKFTNGEYDVKIESRTSDAVAIAIRCNAPIYTTPEVLLTTGTIFENEPDETDDDTDDRTVEIPVEPYDDMDLDELEEALAALIADENYEEAAKVSNIIKSRKNNFEA